MGDLDRKYAWTNIKSAIRTYAKDPTTQHAKRVEEAWREIRQMETPSYWQEWQAAKLNASDASTRSRQQQ